jgi:hypothetical protein
MEGVARQCITAEIKTPAKFGQLKRRVVKGSKWGQVLGTDRSHRRFSGAPINKERSRRTERTPASEMGPVGRDRFRLAQDRPGARMPELRVCAGLRPTRATPLTSQRTRSTRRSMRSSTRSWRRRMRASSPRHTLRAEADQGGLDPHRRLRYPDARPKMSRATFRAPRSDALPLELAPM